MHRIASYNEKDAAFVLEPGVYYIRVGNHSRNTHIIAGIHIGQKWITDVFDNSFDIDEPFEELSSKEAAGCGYPEEASEKMSAPIIEINPSCCSSTRAAYSGEPAEKTDHTEKHLTLDDVKAGTASLPDLVAQLTVRELAQLCVGSSREDGNDSVIGTASATVPGAAGDTTSRLMKDRKIPNLVMADGPAGLRLSRTFITDKNGELISALSESSIDIAGTGSCEPSLHLPVGATKYYQYCTALPIASCLAQTWDPDALEEAGDIVGEEMEEYGVALWLAPGMNIHRNPLCGRNFEYYSEDPLVSGLCAASEINGVQKHPGRYATIKHFALNNQEDNRMHENAHVHERAIREIYLRGFEIAVKKASPKAVMTAFNLVNGEHAANSYDLLTKTLRDEWGFDGIVMTDWGATGTIEMSPDVVPKYGSSSSAGCIRAGNDLIMPGSQKDEDNLVKAAEGNMLLTKAELQSSAIRILQLLL